MSKKKKAGQHRQGGTSHGRPQEAAPLAPKKPWWFSMVVGGAVILAVLGGTPYVLSLLGDKDSRSISTSSSSNATASLPDKPSTTTKPASTPASSAAKAPARGVVAMLPKADKAAFGGDEAMATEFSTAVDEFLGSKSPMVVRNNLNTLLAKASSNPGREHILAMLTHLALRTRDTDAAIGHADALLQAFPQSKYAGVTKAMRIEAELTRALPKTKEAQADPVAMQKAITDAEALMKVDSSDEVQAHARYLVATAKDQLGQKDEAVRLYTELAEKYPQSAKAITALLSAATTQRKAWKFEESLASFERLAQQYPADSAAKEARKAIRELKLIGQVAPDLEVEDWASGSPTNLSSLKGKLVLVNFWQTWCPHCKDELPHLSALYQKYAPQGLVVIGATRNDSRQTPDTLKEFLNTNPLPFLVPRVAETSAKAYAVSGVPAAALVGRDGKVVYRGHPNGVTEKEIEAWLARK